MARNEVIFVTQNQALKMLGMGYKTFQEKILSQKPQVYKISSQAYHYELEELVEIYKKVGKM